MHLTHKANQAIVCKQRVELLMSLGQTISIFWLQLKKKLNKGRFTIYDLGECKGIDLDDRWNHPPKKPTGCICSTVV